MARELQLLNGALGGVNTMLNVVGVKENMKDRQFNRERTAKFDKIAEEDREELRGDRATERARRLVLNQQSDEDRARQNYWADILNEQNSRLSNLNIEDAQYRANRRPALEGQQDALFDQQRILGEQSIRANSASERQRALTESYNLLRGFNSFVDGETVEEPAVMNALNYFLQSRINNDPSTANKTIKGLTPTPDGQGVMVELGVEPKSGESYSAPLTRNRSSDTNDPVVVVPYQDLFALVSEVSDDLQEAGFQGSMPQITRQLEEYLRVVSGDRSVEQAAAALAKDEQDHARAVDLENVKSTNRKNEATHRASIGGGSNQTINTIEYFRNNMANPDGSAISVAQAVEIANLSKSDPREAVIRVYQQLSNAQNSSLMPGMQAERATEEQLMTRAQEMVGALSKSVMPTSGVTGVAGGGLRQPERAVESGELLDELPDAAQYNGMIATDEESGIEYQSNGVEWVRIN